MVPGNTIPVNNPNQGLDFSQQMLLPKLKVGSGHCVKSVRIWSFSGPYFSAFGLNTERCSVFPLI